LFKKILIINKIQF